MMYCVICIQFRMGVDCFQIHFTFVLSKQAVAQEKIV